MDIKKDTKFTLVTTAALPWMTGTSVNPLWRAITLAKLGFRVRLFHPWIEKKFQHYVFPEGILFDTKEDHKNWIRSHYPCNEINLEFYDATYSPSKRSIFPNTSLSESLGVTEVLLLEEPEHLLKFNLFSNKIFKKKATRVIGIIHTNYSYYTSEWTKQQLPLGQYIHPLASLLKNLIIRQVVTANCDQVICLSRVTDFIGNSAIYLNINGISDEFIQLELPLNAPPSFYFMGKLIWEKGFLHLFKLTENLTNVSIDVFGNGPQEGEIRSQASKSKGAKFHFKGPSIEPWKDLKNYSCLINTSISEVLCTVSLEALAMGKFVIMPKHKSNIEFSKYPNALLYSSPNEFRSHIITVKNSQPTNFNRSNLSWLNATTTFLKAIQDVSDTN